MTWHTDSTLAPKDKRVWLATKCGKVSATYWDEKRGAWSGLAQGEQPVAWQLYVKPEHPHNAVSDGGLNILTRHTDITLPIIDDVGSGV